MDQRPQQHNDIRPAYLTLWNTTHSLPCSSHANTPRASEAGEPPGPMLKWSQLPNIGFTP